MTPRRRSSRTASSAYTQSGPRSSALAPKIRHVLRTLAFGRDERIRLVRTSRRIRWCRLHSFAPGLCAPLRNHSNPSLPNQFVRARTNPSVVRSVASIGVAHATCPSGRIRRAHAGGSSHSAVTQSTRSCHLRAISVIRTSPDRFQRAPGVPPRDSAVGP